MRRQREPRGPGSGGQAPDDPAGRESRETADGATRHTRQVIETTAAAPARPGLQRRMVVTLVGSQMLGGVGVASGITVGSLLAADLAGNETWAGLANTFQVIGSALIAIPVARLMAARGRRPGLLAGYGVAFVGAVLVLVAMVVRNFPLLLVGALLFGGATTANNQARYAAVDLSEERHRGRDLSIVVWSTTLGAVLGPNLTGPGGNVADLLGLPRLVGGFVFSLVGFALAAALLATRLRPDPLLVARQLAYAEGDSDTPEHRSHGSVTRGLRVIGRYPMAAMGLIAAAVAHAVMVSIMVMTPLHMQHGHAELRVIGFVISMHVLGMFAFSPLVGMAVDRLGGLTVALVGAGILIVAGLMAAASQAGWSMLLMIALFLLGLGWSCAYVSGSTMLAAALPVEERAGGQGAADLMMGLVAGGGGALAGVVVDHFGYRELGLGAAVLAVVIVVAAAVIRPGRRAPASALVD